MSIKIGSETLTSAGSASYNGTSLNKIIYNGTVVWVKGGNFMPDNDLALYGLTYSGGVINYKVASRHDADYMWITASSEVEVKLKLEFIWAGEIKSVTVGTNAHYQSTTQVFSWTTSEFTVPAAPMSVIPIPAITGQTVAATLVTSSGVASPYILNGPLVIVHNLTTGEDSIQQVYDDGTYVVW